MEDLIRKYKISKTNLKTAEILCNVARQAITTPLIRILEIMCEEERKVYKEFQISNPSIRIPAHIKPILYPGTIVMEDLKLNDETILVRYYRDYGDGDYGWDKVKIPLSYLTLTNQGISMNHNSYITTNLSLNILDYNVKEKEKSIKKELEQYLLLKEKFEK